MKKPPIISPEGERKLIAALERELSVNRANDTASLQPRFSNQQSFYTDMWASYMNFAKRIPQIPVQRNGGDNRDRDGVLAEIWKMEPHTAGVVNSVENIDGNRGWTLRGGRNQVMRFSRVLHSADSNAEGMGGGWREYFKKCSRSYHTSDVGSMSEIGRVGGENGPLGALYSFDPLRCILASLYSMNYIPSQGNRPMKFESPRQYFRCASMSSTDESMVGMGFCALSRIIDFVRLMKAVYEYDMEELGAQAMTGLLMLNGIKQDQWDEAMKDRRDKLTAKEQEWFAGVTVLASPPGVETDAKLVALSNLPKGYQKREWVDLMMYATALCFGYDAAEFWPVSTGGLGGRSQETSVQHRKASGKGAADFPLTYQEDLQEQLPDSLEFTFDERDVEGDIAEVNLSLKKAELVTSLYESGLAQGAGLLTKEQALSLAAQLGIIDKDWALGEEDVEATDNTPQARQIREESRENAYVVRAATKFPLDPIIQYQYRGTKSPRIITLWESGDALLRPQVWRGVIPAQSATAVTRAVLYENKALGFTITDKDVDTAIEEGRKRVGDEYAELLTAEPMTATESAKFE